MESPVQPQHDNGWRPGWTLAAKPEHLFRETASPLLVSLSETPFVLNLQIPQLNARLTLSMDKPGACELRAEGIRVRYDADGREMIVSFFMQDANTLIVECDEPRLTFSYDGVLTERENPSAVIADASPYRLVMAVDQKAAPAHTAIVAGLGDVEMLLGKARGGLSLSAHEQLDHVFQSVDDDASGEYGLAMTAALEYVKSRLRPASKVIPFPWISLEQETPSWDVSLTWLLVRALITREPEVAGGLIGNLVELANPEGLIPVEGGKDAPPRHGPATLPVIVQMIRFYREKTGAWPAGIDPGSEGLARYLSALLEAATSSAAQGESTFLWDALIYHEVKAWLEVREWAGLPVDASARRIRDNARLLPDRHRETPAEEAVHWLILTDPRRAKGLSNETIRGCLDAARVELTTDQSPSATDAWVLAGMADEQLSRHHPSHAASWRQSLAGLSRDHGLTFMSEIPAESRAGRHSEMLRDAAIALSWHRDPAASGQRDGATSPLWWRLDRHRRALAVAVAALLFGLIGLVAYLQFFRPTLPGSVFEAHAGMILQHYRAGEFDLALEKVAELEQRQYAASPLLLFVKGKIYFRQANFEQAIATFSQVMEKNPRDPSAAFNLGLSYFQTRQYQKALDMFQQTAAQFERTHPSMAHRARRAAELTAVLMP